MLSPQKYILKYREYENMTEENILETFFNQRKSSNATQRAYRLYVRQYEEFTSHTLSELLDIAEQEEKQNIRWKNTRTREFLLGFREYVHSTYSINTAKSRITAILTIYRHFEYEIPRLPYFSDKQTKRYSPIIYDDLPDREILTEACKLASPRAKALILFMSSSGLSRVDTHNLTIKDYLDAVFEYTGTYDLNSALEQMRGKDIIPTFHLRRQKTGQDYVAFCSPEAVKAINVYLENRTDEVTLDSQLFKIYIRYLNKTFETLNDKMDLGKRGAFNRFRAHMLRKYHASQLAEAGMSTEKINLLQGRKVKGVAHESYIRIKTDTLKQEYIEALPYLVVEDVNKVKTELQRTKSELETAKTENTEMKQNLKSILERIQKLEQK